MKSEAFIYQPEPTENIIQFPGVAKTYEIDYDSMRAFREKAQLDGAADYIKSRDSFFSYITDQMETHLGERFNVELSAYSYDIKDGLLWGKEMNEPFIDSIKRGRDVRRQSGNGVDYAREDAEVVGFEKIQQTLLDPETPVGTMMLSISPKGGKESTYQHNFYDIFTLKEDDGEKYVETRRYSSALGVAEYEEKLLPFVAIDINPDDPAASFLSQPIAIQNTLTPDDIHAYLHKKYETMSTQQLEVIKTHCKNLAEGYARSVWVEPHNKERHKVLFNAYINKADELKDLMDGGGGAVLEKVIPIGTAAMVEDDVNKYGYQEVRKVMTGCGASEGYAVYSPTSSPFSVGEFSDTKWEYHKGNCVVCNQKDLEVGPCSICKKCEKKF